MILSCGCGFWFFGVLGCIRLSSTHVISAFKQIRHERTVYQIIRRISLFECIYYVQTLVDSATKLVEHDGKKYDSGKVGSEKDAAKFFRGGFKKRESHREDYDAGMFCRREGGIRSDLG